MKQNFVTLFNANYLSRGLVMYQSLLENCKNFHLYVIAFDDTTYVYFKDYPQNHLTVISLAEFEDEKLLSVKSSRTAAEYCWTCTASTILYCINRFQLDHCVYIDADMRFYSDPISLFNEWGSKSVLITEHRYSPAYDQSSISGIYCVQYVGFKNDKDGMEALTYWRNVCIDWCYARAEDGKFGDQKYLDDWPQRFNNVHVLQHLGGGVAPWNMEQYNFRKQGHLIIGKEIKSNLEFNVVFFHFHGLKLFEGYVVAYTNGAYDMSKEAKQLFFRPYVLKLTEIGQKLFHVLPKVNFHAINGISPQKPLNLLLLLKWYLYDVLHSKSIFGQRTRQRIRKYHFHKIN